MSKRHYRPPHPDRDPARPPTRPGLRWRILNLPVMLGLVLAMIWRQVPSISPLAHTLSREGLLWVAPRKASQQALSERLRTLPCELFEEVLLTALPKLLAHAPATDSS